MTRAFLSYAKINLYLAVRGRRPDGYHEVDTVLQSVSLADRLVFRTAPDGVLEVECDAEGIPSGRKNLVGRALDLLRQRARVRAGVRVTIEKTIPVESGLGGGSSNAACALGAANCIWGLGLCEQELEALGAEIGSDVPFFVRGGTQRCRGRGERLDVLPPLPDSLWLIVRPSWGQGTAEVYARVSGELTSSDDAITMVLERVAKQDLAGVVRTRFNDLESAAQYVRPMAAEVRSFLEVAGLVGVTQTGSGSAWCAPCPDAVVGERVRAQAIEKGWRAYLVEPTRGGWRETTE